MNIVSHSMHLILGKIPEYVVLHRIRACVFVRLPNTYLWRWRRRISFVWRCPVVAAAAPYLRWIPTKQLPLTHLTSTCSDTWPVHAFSLEQYMACSNILPVNAFSFDQYMAFSLTWPVHAVILDLTSTWDAPIFDQYILSHLTSMCSNTHSLKTQSRII